MGRDAAKGFPRGAARPVQSRPGRARPDTQGSGGFVHWQPVNGDEFEHGSLVFWEPFQRLVCGPAGALRVDPFLKPGDVIVVE